MVESDIVPCVGYGLGQHNSFLAADMSFVLGSIVPDFYNKYFSGIVGGSLNKITVNLRRKKRK
jgi:hypothetical protein